MKIASTDTVTQNDYTAPQIIDPYPQSQNHTQWPGNGTRGDSIFDSFMFSMISLTSNATRGELSTRAAGCTLLEAHRPLLPHLSLRRRHLSYPDERPMPLAHQRQHQSRARQHTFSKPRGKLHRPGRWTSVRKTFRPHDDSDWIRPGH